MPLQSSNRITSILSFFIQVDMIKESLEDFLLFIVEMEHINYFKEGI